MITRVIKQEAKENSQIEVSRTIFFMVAFLLMLILPFITIGNANVSATENRKLEQKPKFGFDGPVYEYPLEYESYLKDNFHFRRTLTELNSRVNLSLLASSDIEDVLIGKEGWLFNGGEKAIGAYQRLNSFSDKDLSALKRYFRNKQKMFEKKGISYYFVLAPDKHSVYSEQLPFSVREIGTTSRYNQLKDVLEDVDVSYIDLKPALVEAKNASQVYYKYDSHWNYFGSYVAYKELMSCVQKDYLEITALSEEDFKIKLVDSTLNGLSRNIGISQKLEDEELLYKIENPKAQTLIRRDPMIRVFTTNQPELPNLLVTGDSFMRYWVLTYLSQNFNNTVFIREPFANVSDEILEILEPDIIIDEVLERYLMGDTNSLTSPEVHLKRISKGTKINLYDVVAGNINKNTKITSKDKFVLLETTATFSEINFEMNTKKSKGEVLVVGIDLQSSANSRARLLYQTSESYSFSTDHSMEVKAMQGLNQLRFRIPNYDSLTGRFRLEFVGEKGAVYRIFEIMQTEYRVETCASIPAE